MAESIPITAPRAEQRPRATLRRRIQQKLMEQGVPRPEAKARAKLIKKAIRDAEKKARGT